MSLPCDPSHSPFDLPIAKMVVQCRSEAPIRFATTEGAHPGTVLNGLLGIGLLNKGCRFGYKRAVECLENKNKLSDCSCAAGMIYKPQNFPRPVRLLFHERPSPKTSLFSLELIFWGRRALNAENLMLNVLEFMGKSGLQTGFDKKFTFSVLDVTEIFRGALKEKIRACLSSQKITNRLLLEFPNVFIFKETLNVKGQPARLAMAEGEFPLAKVLGNVANELVRWDLEDRGLADQMEKSRVDMLAEAARKSAESSITGIEIDHAALRPVDLGERASRKNNTKRSLRGFVGHVVLRGNLLPAMGWLEVLALWGGGQEKSSGLGQVKLWVPFNT